jgi:predicted HicB family RNase H-like nuclease
VKPTPPAHPQSIPEPGTDPIDDTAQRVLQTDAVTTSIPEADTQETPQTQGNVGFGDVEETVKTGGEDVRGSVTVARPEPVSDADMLTADEAADMADDLDEQWEPDAETVLEAKKRTMYRQDSNGRTIKLTPNQERYCELRAEGRKQVDAYAEAYEGCEDTMSRKTIGEMASRTEAKPHIRARIAAMKAARKNVLYYDRESLRIKIMDALVDVMEGGQKDSDRVSAAKALGTMSHMNLWTADKDKGEEPLDTLSDADLMKKVSDMLKPKG